ncbi:MAG: DUF4340 domain-containing protein [Spirochaetaceae bacterium]|nr:MAG: DUF4340 domain-containing protein [Spirochaetaceae bacterium]
MEVLSFQRKVLILGICIAVLAAAYVLGLVFSPARVGQREAEAPLLAGFDRLLRDRVAEIRISSEEGSLRLQKQQDAWVLPGSDRNYPASASLIGTFLDFLSDVARARVVTDNPDAWKEFEVHSEALSRIQLLDASGGELSEIIIGKTAAGGGVNYLRLGDSNEVVLSNRSFDYYLNVEEKFWAHLRIFPEDLEGIMRISVDSSLQFDPQSPASIQYTLVLSSEQPAVWKLVDRPEGELDNGKVDLLASNLANLEGTEFAYGVSPAESGLTDPSARILISTVDNRDYRLLVGEEAGDDQYYATLDNGTFIYKVSEWRLKGVIKGIEELRVENAGEQ